MTMPEITDPWKLSSGLRDDMVLSIHDAYFAPDAEYQGGRVLLLHLIGLDELEEPQTLKLSIGADWETPDGGNTVTHPTKKQQRINGSTIYGHWISHAQEIPALVAELQQRPGGPINSKVWAGLILHLQERDLVFGRNIEPQKRLMPTEYFGLIAVSPNGNVPNVQMATLQQLPMGIPQVPVAAVVDPSALIAQARAQAAAQSAPASPLYQKYFDLARTVEWPIFLATALADPEVLADDELAQQCADQSQLYTMART
jgi:hypothetical protein